MFQDTSQESLHNLARNVHAEFELTRGILKAFEEGDLVYVQDLMEAYLNRDDLEFLRMSPEPLEDIEAYQEQHIEPLKTFFSAALRELLISEGQFQGYCRAVNDQKKTHAYARENFMINSKDDVSAAKRRETNWAVYKETRADTAPSYTSVKKSARTALNAAIKSYKKRLPLMAGFGEERDRLLRNLCSRHLLVANAGFAIGIFNLALLGLTLELEPALPADIKNQIITDQRSVVDAMGAILGLAGTVYPAMWVKPAIFQRTLTLD